MGVGGREGAGPGLMCLGRCGRTWVQFLRNVTSPKGEKSRELPWEGRAVSRRPRRKLLWRQAAGRLPVRTC